MTRKLNFIPHIDNYEWIRNQMKEDLITEEYEDCMRFLKEEKENERR